MDFSLKYETHKDHLNKYGLMKSTKTCICAIIALTDEYSGSLLVFILDFIMTAMKMGLGCKLVF